MRYYVEAQSPLYEAVQGSGLFADSKFFTDCTPRQAPEAILDLYAVERHNPAFDLKDFVARHYVFPENPQLHYASAGKTIDQHIHALWPLLTRRDTADDTTSTRLSLPYPYIVPGGRFREIYYWDTYFTCLGLQAHGQHAQVRHMAGNFAWLIDTVGFVPNGSRTYYLSRSQPPFFALLVGLVAQTDPDAYTHYLPALTKEYAFWMDGADKLGTDLEAHRRVVRLPDGSMLNRYWDDLATPRPEAWAEDTHLAAQSAQKDSQLWRHVRAAAESGWDFSSRWFSEATRFDTIQTTDLLPVDLNCLLYFLETQLAKGYAQQNDATLANYYQLAAQNRATAIHRYNWDAEKQFFSDFHWKNKQFTPHLTLAGIFPLFLGLATSAQAQAVAARIEHDFLQAGGLVTTLHQTGQQWDAPNGWAPLQWIGYVALKQYGFDALASELRQRWLALNERVYAETGKMMEKYNVVDSNVTAGGGEYPNQDGFGWTNGVYVSLKAAAAMAI